MRKASLALPLGLVLVTCGGGETIPSAPTSGPTDAPTTPASTPAGQTLTGVWEGTFNETIKNCRFPGVGGVADYTLRLDLTQSGSNVSGSGLAVVSGRFCNDGPGTPFALAVTGSVSGAVVLLRLVEASGSADLTGTVSGNTMGGSLVNSEGGAGTWSVTR
jgi:hypothetical protein